MCSSAARSRSSASARVAPWAMSLASIGSYRSLTTSPCATPGVDPHAVRPAQARRRARSRAGSRASGSSAYSRASIAWPRDRRRLLGPGRPSVAPAAIASWSATRSRPVTRLGDRVLDLEPRVHLEEEELAVIGQEHLDRAGADVAGGAPPPPGRPSPIRSRSSAVTDGAGASSTIFWLRRCAEQSRSPRWTPRAGRVEEDLHLDVARTFEEALEDEPIVAEGPAPPRAARAASASPSSAGVADDPHPLAAAAGATASRGAGSRCARPRLPALRPPAPAVVAGHDRARPWRPLVRRAAALSPIAAIASAGGPDPGAARPRHRPAKAGFSARKP